MDIRTKLAFAIVTTNLVAMLLLGWFAYQTSAMIVERVSERQLDAIAESKAQDLAHVIEGWQDRVRLIASRTQLRLSLDAIAKGEAAGTARLERILADAEWSSTEVERIALFDHEGRLVATAGEGEHTPQPARAGPADVVVSDTRTVGFYFDSTGTPKVVVASLLRLEGRVVGSIEVVLDAERIESVAENLRGLGETGEVLVLAFDTNDRPRLLHDRRHGEPPAGGWAAVPFARAALSGEHGVFTDGAVDDRGNEVWAATRYIEPVGWGLVVKVDAAEEREPVAALRADMIDLGLALAAFAIAGGTALGYYLGRPIRNLANLVGRLGDGETGLRAEVQGGDEVAVLSAALNEWIDEVDRRAADKPRE